MTYNEKTAQRLADADDQARAIRLNAAERKRDEYEAGEISVDSFRSQILAIARPAMETRDAPHASLQVNEPEKRDNERSYTIEELNGMSNARRGELGINVRSEDPVWIGPARGAGRGHEPAKRETGRAYRDVRGIKNERLSPDQSFADYVAARSGTPADFRSVPHDFAWDAYWSATLRRSLGLGGVTDNAETRAVTGWGEDISSGSGAGAGIVGQVWSSTVIDLIRAHTFSDKLGVTVMPLETELTNVPEFQADVSPVWVAEGASIQGDVSPSVNTIQFNAAGAVLDIVPVSKNLIMDAINTGGVDALVRNSIAQKYARVIDQTVLYGISGNVGNPGLCAESGLMTATASHATNYLDLSAGAEKVRAQNVEPSGFLWPPHTMSAYAQLVDTLGQPLRMTPDIANVNFVNSGLLNYQTESSTGVFNDGSVSSIYVGDWSYVTIGMRTEGVMVNVLNELLAANNQVGFMSAARF